MDFFTCKRSCIGSDKNVDTVKVNPALLAADKENVGPVLLQNKANDIKQQEEEKRRAQEEARQQIAKDEERRQMEEQARKRRQEEAARLREEAAAVERAAAERRAAEERAAEQRRAQEAREEEQRRLEAARAAAEAKERQEREAAEEARRLEEQRVAEEKVNAWCKAHGFSDINAKKKSFMSGTKCPLHLAVAKNDAEMVGLLLEVGADKTLKNSKGKTAEEVAQKMNKNGCMDAILAKLA